MTSLPSKPVETTLFPDVKYQNRYQVSLLKIFAIIVSGLGLIWYTLTKVTRAPFPSENLESWSLNPNPELNMPLSFRIHLSQSDWGTLLSTKLQNQRFTTPGPINLTPVFHVKTTDSIPSTNWTMADLPHVTLPRLETENKVKELTYNVILVPGNELGIYFSEQFPLSIYILFPSDVKYDQVQNLILHGINEILGFLSDHDNNKVEVDYNLQYQLLFTSLHGSPPSEDGFLGSPLAQIVEDVIMPSVESLQPLSHFEVATQAQYYAPLAISPKKILGQEGSWYAVDPQQQSLFINSAWDLASVSPAPDLHFLIFVPPPELTPLHLVDHIGVKVPSNSFIVPQWGGLVILNPDDSGKISEAQVREAISIHLKHFCDLFGLKLPGIKPFSSATVKLSPHGLNPLAFDRYRLRRTAFFATKATATLYALRHLINKIPAMEVSYESMKTVKRSISDLISGRQALSKGYISLALFKFNKAFLTSEASFFHPSMVAQMYFPPDAAYAIFLPLLLPAVLPLFMTTLKFIRNLKKAQK